MQPRIIEYHLPDGQTVTIKLKAYMQFQDGLQKTRLERDITQQTGADPNEDGLAGLVLISNYPLIVTGTESAEGIPWPLSVEDFWKLPEDLVLLWVEAVREVNPQHANPFSALLSGILNGLETPDYERRGNSTTTNESSAS